MGGGGMICPWIAISHTCMKQYGWYSILYTGSIQYLWIMGLHMDNG